jgi:hypothetical protein
MRDEIRTETYRLRSEDPGPPYTNPSYPDPPPPNPPYSDPPYRDTVPVSRTAAPLFPAALRRISWGAVFAGVVVATAVQVLLTLLGVAIGLGTVNPMREQNPFAGIGVGTGICSSSRG